MRRLFNIACVLVVSCLSIACGNNSKKVTFKNVDIYGDICYWENDAWESEDYETDKYLSVDDGSCRFYIDKDRILVKIPVRTVKVLPYNGFSLKPDMENTDIQLWAMDELGFDIKNSKGDDVTMELANPEILENIITSKEGDKNILEFYYPIHDEKKDILNQIGDFALCMDIDIDLL